MNITIQRFRPKYKSIDGLLKINGKKVCDTAECAESAIKAGTYEVTMCLCKQIGRQRIVLGNPDCKRCPITCVSGLNTKMPCRCPAIIPGNGVVGRNDGSIIIGERVVDGVMIHPLEHYNKLHERIRKAIIRGTQVEVTIL